MTPTAFIEAAGDAGLDAVSLFVQAPGPQSHFQLTTAQNLSEVRKALSDTGVTLKNIECFMLTPKTDISQFRPAIETGSALGATHLTTILYDDDEQRVRDHLGQLGMIAAEHGLGVAIEFMAFTPRWNRLHAASALIDSLADPRFRLVVDCLHLVRSGGSAADVAALPAGRVATVQLCDSLDTSAHADYLEEAGVRRLGPGQGSCALSELMAAVEPGCYLELEVPDPSAENAAAHLAALTQQTRAWLQQTAGRG
jgi:sugar phosphate isomerase/epimerase